ncbi:MAG: DUF434 domain-containing protein [Aureispira sp.]
MKHRGKHSNDDKNFAPKWKPIFKEAASDLSYLLGRSYGEKSALALVGNRYQLNKRQQRALHLMACPAPKIAPRRAKQVAPSALKGKKVSIDGYNVLIGMEVALSRGYLFVGQDGCYRDIASVHGTYKKVEETLPALEQLEKSLRALEVAHVQWYFDSPVSNSGRLKTLLYELATKKNAPWDIELVFNPDTILVERNQLTISADSWILDSVDAYFDLVGYTVKASIPDAEIWNLFEENEKK